MKVLLADSSVYHLNRMVKAVKKGKHEHLEIQVAMTVSEAYELLGNQRFDLIISDSNLVDESGIQLLGFVKEHIPECEIALYANIDEQALKFYSKTLDCACFSKPNDFNKVVNYVRTLTKQ